MVGLAVATANTGPAASVTLVFRHCDFGIQNHSGRPTSPSLPIGGAVLAVSVGTDNSPIAILSSSPGLIAGAPDLVLPCTSGPPIAPAAPGQVMMSHW